MNQPTPSRASVAIKWPAYAFISTDGRGHLCLRVQVIPNARQTSIDGLHGEAGQEALKIRLQAPPVDGKANGALIKWLARLLGLHQRELQIERGHSSRLKQLQLSLQAADRANWQALQAALERVADSPSR